MVDLGMLRSGSRTLAAPMADRLLSPLTFQGVKLPDETKNRPTVDMRANGMNFSTVVHTWTAPMLRTPVRLIRAGIHRPTRAIAIDQPTTLPLFRKCST